MDATKPLDPDPWLPTTPRVTASGLPWLSALYDEATRNLLEINTVPGRGPGEPAAFVRAGGGYAEPWTRDASLNAWGAASVLEPEVARDTLLLVCDRDDDGRRLIAQDNQWWDQIVWIVSAWQHVLATSDRVFLAEAFQIGRDSLAILHRDRFRPRWGLYAGGSLMQDGISGYPAPPADEVESSSFVLDYPATHEILCLSTNVLYVEALRCLDRMARLLGADVGAYSQRADALSAAIDEHLWIEESGLYGYFLHGDGPLAGTLARHEEAAGLALAVVFGVADAERADRILTSTHRQPHGVVNVWPHFAERYSDERPGRHNVICWPMVMGLFGLAGAEAGRPDVVEQTLDDFRRLVEGSDGRFFELYDSVTGAVSGGWQTGRVWESLPDQTWSATSFIRLVHAGVLGIRHEADGLSFTPQGLPGAGDVAVSGFPFRRAQLDVTVTGGGPVVSVTVDGVDVAARRVPADLSGRHEVVVRRA